MSTWDDGSRPDMPRLRGAAWLLIPLRAIPLVVLVFGGLAVLMLVRLIEKPLCGMDRPVTPQITRFVCRNALRIIGIRLNISGQPMRQRGAVVSNHSSWLDIFALNASQTIYFVAKSEVARWPGIGWLAQATGTLFIERNQTRARMQTELFQTRLMAGHRLLFFPEGTSTDGRQVLPFKTTLFQSFYDPRLRDTLWVQPCAVVYRAPPGSDPRLYSWWGDMEFAPHLLSILIPARQGHIDIVYGRALKVAEYADRKALACACERAVREAHASVTEQHQGSSGKT